MKRQTRKKRQKRDRLQQQENQENQETTQQMEERKQKLSITAPNFRTATYKLIGSAFYVQNRFANKEAMMNEQIKGKTNKQKAKRTPKDFKKMFINATHRGTAGEYGIPATAFRAALISACRLCNFKMVLAKLSIFVDGDCFSKDGIPLVKFRKGKPKKAEHAVRLPHGSMDIHARPMWSPGWRVNLTVRWDNDQFSLEEVTNLLMRVGMQVGVGEGRPDSKNSTGMGWGLFDIMGK